MGSNGASTGRIDQRPRITRRPLRLEPLEARILLSAGAADAVWGGSHDDHPAETIQTGPYYQPYRPPAHHSVESAGFLSDATQGAPLDIAVDFLENHAAELGLSHTDVSQFRVIDQYATEHNGVTHIYLRQTHNGLDVRNAEINVNVTSDGRVVNAGSTFIPGLNLSTEVIELGGILHPSQALGALANELGWAVDAHPVASPPMGTSSTTALLAGSAVSSSEIPASLQYVSVADGVVELAWGLQIQSLDGAHWYNASVSAHDGRTLDLADWIDHAQYNVFPLPLEDPDAGNRSIELDPQDSVASPFGWHDTDGVDGAEFNDTRGNNVFAQEDRAANNSGTGIRPDGGGALDFDFTLDLDLEPVDYQSASVTNLFYWNNILHDVHYQYGFDEQAGNFQVNNYGRGGVGGDSLQADAQYAAPQGEFNNASFGTPPDGMQPRMLLMEFEVDVPHLSVVSPSLTAEFRGEAAQFGPQLTASEISHSLVAADPALGCELLNNPGAVSGKIALLDRGDCTFVQKVQIAQDIGAVAVVLVNNVVSAPIEMADDGNGGTIAIPSVMISQSDGAAIRTALGNGEDVAVALSIADVPNRDSALDSSIIIHEYGHGVSNRLAGGPSNADALDAIQSEGLGEGWSDWWSLMFTQESTDTQFDAYPLSTYVLGQDHADFGIRRFPYSFDMAVNPLTYDDFNSSNDEHDAGEIWASALWDMNWLLIDEHGFDADLYGGAGGNNLAMQLVMDGLKLQPPNPSFLDARDAVLLADLVLTGGENQDHMWRAFARREMGFSADDGGDSSATTVVAAFDEPGVATGNVAFDAEFYFVDSTVKISLIDLDQNGNGSIEVTVSASGGDNETVALSEVDVGVFEGTIVTAPAPFATNGVLEVLIGETITVSYNDLLNETGSPVVVTDVAEIAGFNEIYVADFAGAGGAADLDGFTIDNTGAEAFGLWHLSGGRGGEVGHSGQHSLYFGANEAASGDGSYDVGNTAGRVTSPSIDVPQTHQAHLTFNYFLETENSKSFDNAMVLISVDGAAFNPASSNMAGELIDPTLEWHNALIDLTPFAGSSVQFQFAFETVDEQFNDYEGWFIDDVAVRAATAVGLPASGIRVTGLSDVVANDGVVTLREAILAANTDSDPSGDVPVGSGDDLITFDKSLFLNGARSIALSSALPAFASNIEILGPGADLLAIRRNNGGDYRILTIDVGQKVAVEAVTLADGGGSSFANGGAVSNAGDFTFSNSTITNSRADNGGAIHNANGASLTLVNSLINDNLAFFGGAVHNQGMLRIDATRLLGNVAGSTASGGAIQNVAGTVTIVNSTLMNNIAGFGGAIENTSGSAMKIVNSRLDSNAAMIGGGILNRFGSSLIVSNSTLVGNGEAANTIGGGISNYGAFELLNSTISASAAALGAGIYNNSGTMTISNSTVTQNSASGRGGGIFSINGAATVRNSIIAGNFSDTGDPDMHGEFNSLGNNLIADRGSAIGFTDGSNGDLVGSSESPLDPLLGPLKDNWAPTLTHAPLPGSPAIDAGAGSAQTRDQRGMPRSPRGENPDIGAHETQVIAVTNTQDSGAGSLRQAIADAHEGDTVRLESSGTITLTSDQLSIDKSIVIEGQDSSANAVSGDDNFRVFEVVSGNTVAIARLTITNGFVNNKHGGGIFNGGVLTLTNAVVTNNIAIFNAGFGFGGGIYNDGDLAIKDSVINLNRSDDNGGGIYNAAGKSLNLNNTTVANNSSDDSGGGLFVDEDGEVKLVATIISDNGASSGGGIFNKGSVDATNVVVSNNNSSAFGGGGGISNEDGANFVLQDSTVSGNDASSGGGIFNVGQLEVRNSTIDQNRAEAGAGIRNFSTAIVIGSTVSNNIANITPGGEGGGIKNTDEMIIINSTISGNEAEFSGGGVYNDGILTVNNATIVANTAEEGSGAGIFGAGGTLTLHSTILAGNLQGEDEKIVPGDLDGAVEASSAYNLIGVAGSASGFVNGVNSNQVGSEQAPLNPQLGPLQDNGGSTMTHSPLSGSPAVDAGSAVGRSTDQRGSLRSVDVVTIQNAIAGDGSDIGAVEYSIGDLNSDGQVDDADIDLLRSAVIAGTSDPEFNVDGAGDPNIPDGADFDYLIESLLLTIFSDGNLDRKVTFSDFAMIANNLNHINTGWANGNYDVNDETNFDDFIILTNNFNIDLTSESTGENVESVPAVTGIRTVLAVTNNHRVDAGDSDRTQAQDRAGPLVGGEDPAPLILVRSASMEPVLDERSEGSSVRAGNAGAYRDLIDAIIGM